jgi:fermentation-respiration switch protein FrsA (DUF1100 family)
MGLKKPSIILVPFLGAKSHQLKRHRDFLSTLGFPVTVVPLTFSWRPYLSYDYRLGMKALWTDEIETVLNQIPGDKIIFSFSNPSASAIAAIVRRQAHDILALVTDSGPSGNLYESIKGLLKHEFKIPSLTVLPVSLGFYAFWSPQWNKTLKADILQLPEGFPVLTIQGWKDLLISPSQIDEAFEAAVQIDRIKLNLPEAGHLDGLKKCPDLYRPFVSHFLQKNSEAQKKL